MFGIQRFPVVLFGNLSPGPDFPDPRAPRKLPVKPTIPIELWIYEIRTYDVKEFLVTELYERFKAFCEETRVDECGREWTFSTSFEHEELKSSTRRLLRQFFDREEDFYLVFRF